MTAILDVQTDDQNPSVKKTDVFPPADSRWQKKATGKARGNPTKINSNPITDSRVIMEEKAREDLLWDLDTIREQIEQEFNKEPSAFKEAPKQSKQVELQTYKRRDKAQADNKRQLQEDTGPSGKGMGPKRRKVGESSQGKETETLEKGMTGEGMDLDSTGGEADDETRGKNNTPEAGSTEGEDQSTQSLTWLRDYMEKAKREREHAFDVRVACLKHAERPQVNGKKNAIAGISNSSNQYEMLKKERAEEFSEFAAFKYAEKKRARDPRTMDKDKTIPTINDNLQDLRPKARKTGKNQRRKEINNERVEVEVKSDRALLEKEAAVVLSQTEKLKKWNKEYAPEFSSIAQIARGEAPRVIEAARSARRTLRNIRPLITARYVSKAKEWQIATDVAFKIPHFVEGENVIKVLEGKVTTESPLDLFETVPIEEELNALDSQEGSATPPKNSNEVDELNSDLQMRNQKLGSLQEELQQERSKVSSMRDEMKQLINFSERSHDEATKFQNLQEKYSEQVNRLQSELSKTESDKNELQQTLKELRQKEQVDEQKAKLENAEAKCSQAEREVAKLRAETELLRSDSLILAQQLELTKAKLAKAKEDEVAAAHERKQLQSLLPK
ncbi:hypothetical protein CBR_g23507 [Chara braunii]|uniref:Uncharacterized protein n=1 Tax=Chara braunii TaxID=69332 RepID=A0A388L4E8_CHABU|nr:hypothetical protein CBR_g23507 [Chara braunii]|eukprot:GBG77181.1 hypothetical protein CBR_g23507 [Chara braunii]